MTPPQSHANRQRLAFLAMTAIASMVGERLVHQDIIGI